MRFLTLLTLVSLPSLAADTRWGLRWRAPEQCISAADLSAKVEERLGHPVFALNPEFRVDGVLEAGASPRWKGRLTVVSAAGDVMGTREVVGDDADCRKLDARIALMVAISIDPKANGLALPEPAPPVAAPAPAPAPRVSRAPGSVFVELESDDPQATLYRHVGTSFGSNVTITTISKECVAPCAEFIDQPKADFFISGNGISVSQTFSLLTYPEGVKLKVKTGSSALRFLGWLVGSLGIPALAAGAILLATSSATSMSMFPGVPNPYVSTSNPTRDVGVGLLIGGGLALGAAIPMFAFSGTKVEFFPLPAAPAGLPSNTSEI